MKHTIFTLRNGEQIDNLELEKRISENSDNYILLIKTAEPILQD